MASKSLNNVVNDQTIAMNAMIFGYAGHSLVTPHHVIQQLWWTDERIEEKVTPEFITARLRPNEREWLDRPVGFGDLTDDTYMDWILERSRRLFLILTEVGMSSKIFRVIENSWDDEDLPLQKEDIEMLSLATKKNDPINARFFETQFTFLLRELKAGVHIDYAPNEVLPLEYVMGLPPAVTLQNWPRIHLPKKPDEMYVRRKFPLGTPESPDAFEADFMLDIESSRMVEHDHIARIWASYTLKGVGYTVTDFVGHHTLKTFIDHRNPLQYQRLPKPERRYLLLGWLHCLVDAVATMHQIGFCHSAIRPSNIIIDEQNHIAFSDISSLETFQKDKKVDPVEVYTYNAPEIQAATEPSTDRPSTSQDGLLSKPGGRQPSIASKSSSGSEGSNRSVFSRQRLTKSPSRDKAGEYSGFNFGFKRSKRVLRARPRVEATEKADVFSLGCVFLDIVTFMLKKKASDFVKHRSSKQKVTVGQRTLKTDPAFHSNLEKVESWMKVVADAAFEHDDDAFRAVPHILDLIRCMLSRAPYVRPTAREVRDRLHEILSTCTPMENIHCGDHQHDIGVATSSGSGSSDRASTLSLALSTVSDASTIRQSVATTGRVSSILNSYTDRSALSGIAEDDDNMSMRTIGRSAPPPPPIATGPMGRRQATTPPMSPLSLSQSPTAQSRASPPASASAMGSKNRSSTRTWKVLLP